MDSLRHILNRAVRHSIEELFLKVSLGSLSTDTAFPLSASLTAFLTSVLVTGKFKVLVKFSLFVRSIEVA